MGFEEASTLYRFLINYCLFILEKPTCCGCVLDDDDFVAITNYLWQLEKFHIYNLGIMLGLSQHRLKDMRVSDIFLDDVIVAWLRQEDRVKCAGLPSWRRLVEALRHHRVGQNGIAYKIAEDRGIE